MGKRAAAKTAGRSAKAAKAPPGPLDEVLKVVAASDSSLAAALPHALAAGERHEFQQKVVSSAESLLLRLETAARETVAGAEADVELVSADRAKLREALEAAEAMMARRQGEMEVKASEAAAHLQCANEQKKSLEAEKEKKQDLQAERAVVLETREAFEAGLSSLWEPLKASSLPPSQWRERNKKTAALIKLLMMCDIPESLAAAIDAALKMKADVRGSFANVAIASAEEAYKGKMNSLAEDLTSADAAIVSQDAAVVAAETAHGDASNRADAAQEASIAAQNAWAAQSEVIVDLQNQVRGFGRVEEQRAKAVEKANTKLEAMSAVVAAFRGLAAGAPADVAAAETSAPDTGADDAADAAVVAS